MVVLKSEHYLRSLRVDILLEDTAIELYVFLSTLKLLYDSHIFIVA